MKYTVSLVAIFLPVFFSRGQSYPQFGAERKVTITGLTFDAMEPFISADDQILFFNSLNSGGNTNLYYATRVNDTTYTFVGLVGNTLDTAASHLDAVPSLDQNDRFFWVSLREYPTVYENLLNSDYNAGSVTSIKHTYGDFNIYLPGWLIMDAAINYQGDLLYYVNAYFNSCAFGMPCDASLGVAQKVNDTTFNKLANTDGIFSHINDPGYIVYAPQVSADEKEIYFTRILDGTVNSELCVSVRDTPADTFSLPQVIYANNGFVPEATTITNDKTRIYYHQKNSLGVFEIYMRYRTGYLQMHHENEAPKISFYPNPVKDVLFFTPPESGNFSYSVLAQDGRVVCAGNNLTSIDLSMLSSGIYFLIIQQSQFYTSKFVKI